MEAKIESQVLTGDEESLEAKLNQFKSQVRAEAIVSKNPKTHPVPLT